MMTNAPGSTTLRTDHGRIRRESVQRAQAERGSRAGVPQRRKNGRGRDIRDAAVFLAPFLAVYALFVLAPIVQSINMSLYDWDLLGFTREFIGLDNFVRMFWGTDMTWSLTHDFGIRAVVVVASLATALLLRRSGSVKSAILTGSAGLIIAGLMGFHPSAGGRWNDSGFWIALRHTIEFTVITTPITVALGLALALALHGKRRGMTFYRAIFFLPYVLPVSAVTLIWSYLLNPDRGLIAGFLGWFGLDGIAWLADPGLAMPAIIATTVWWTVGFNLVLFLAGLQDIDPSLHEAAALDGAGAWQRFRHVTLPGLRHVMVLVAVTQLISAFQIFGQVYIMTRGGPANSTRVLIQHIYEAGFRDLELGYAAALSLFLFVVMAAVSAIQFRLLSKES